MLAGWKCTLYSLSRILILLTSNTFFQVRLWHDNAGTSPSWYVVQVHVHDLQRDRRYVFPAHTWLSLEEETGKLQKEIQAAGNDCSSTRIGVGVQRGWLPLSTLCSFLWQILIVKRRRMRQHMAF